MTSAETLIENDLHELLGGETPPDLIERTLARLADGNTPEGVVSDDLGSLQPLPLAPPRILLLRRLAVAACALLALGVMAWLVWPQPLPGNVTAATSASYRVKDDHIELKSGWLLLTDGAPEVRVDNGRVNDVQGRAVVGTGIPNAETLDALVIELGLSDTEKEMLKLPKRWLTAGGLALCLLTGQAMLNDQSVSADELPGGDTILQDLPSVNDMPGLKRLLRLALECEVKVWWTTKPPGLTTESEHERVTGLVNALMDEELKRDTSDMRPTGGSTNSELEDQYRQEREHKRRYESLDTFTRYSTIEVRFRLPDGREILVSNIWAPAYEWGLRLPDGSATSLLTSLAFRSELEPLIQSALQNPTGDPPQLIDDDPDATEDFRVLRKWTGADSEITKRRTQFITDADTWASVWQEHTINPMDDPIDPPKLPEVDFAKELVLAVFGGKGTNSKGYFVKEILQGESHWVVRVDESSYQSLNGADDVTPYGIFVFPLTEYVVRAEENVQGLLNQPPDWRLLGEFNSGVTIQSPEILWQPTFQFTGIGGDGRSKTIFVGGVDEWREQTKEFRNSELVQPDFGKSFVVIATDNRLKGAQGSLTLTPYGISAERAVLRLSMPAKSSGGMIESEHVYGVWVMPRNGRTVVIEKPVYDRSGGIDRWIELNMGGVPRSGAIQDFRSGLSGGLEESRYGLATDSAELKELLKGASIEDLPEDWVDWKKESVVVAFPGEQPVDGGLQPYSTFSKGLYIIYSLLKSKGEDTPVNRPWLVIKIALQDVEVMLDETDKEDPSPVPASSSARRVAEFHR